MSGRMPGGSLQPGQPVDWGQVRRRLQDVAETLEQLSEPPPEQARQILKARARALAGKTQGAGAADTDLEIVEFRLAHESYALETRYVREVCPLRELTPLPSTPPFILGITAVRGQILSIIDLKRFFDLPQKGLTDLNKILVVRAVSTELGLLADDLLGVRSLALAELLPPLPTWTGVRGEYLRGMTRHRLVVLDAARILSDERIRLPQSSERPA